MKHVEESGEQILRDLRLDVEVTFDSVSEALNIRDDQFNMMKDLFALTLEVTPLSGEELDTLSVIVSQNLEIQSLIEQRRLETQTVLQRIAGIQRLIRATPGHSATMPSIDIES